MERLEEAEPKIVKIDYDESKIDEFYSDISDIEMAETFEKVENYCNFCEYENYCKKGV